MYYELNKKICSAYNIGINCQYFIITNLVPIYLPILDILIMNNNQNNCKT